MSIRPGDRQTAYRDLRERIKRQERDRAASLKRILDQRRERHLHLFQSRDVTLATATLE